MKTVRTNALTTRIRRAAGLLGVGLLMMGWGAQAGTLYWDGANTNDANSVLGGANLGGDGTWDNGTTPNWWSGTGADVAWNNANSDTAVFWGTAGTVTLGGIVTNGGLAFNTTGYRIDAGAYTLTFGSGNNALTLNNVAAATISNAVAGAGSVTLTGGAYGGNTAGTLTLAGTSAGGWTGATTIGGGMILLLTNANQALLNTSGITLNSGGKLWLANDATTTNLNRVSDTAPITVNGGGRISYANPDGATYTETFGAITVNSGDLSIDLPLNHPSTATQQTLSVSSLTHNGSATVYFQSANMGITLSKGNNIKVIGGGTTTAGQIVGPWAYVNTQNSVTFAAYTNDFVVGATLTTTNETGWTDANKEYTLTNATTTLTADRTIAGLRIEKNVVTLDVGNNKLASSAFVIGANNGYLSIIASGSGTLTAPGTTGGNIYFRMDWNWITNSAPIVDNGGPVTVVSSSSLSPYLVLNSSGSTFSGGVVLNSGGMTISSATTNFSGGVTINGGTLTISSDANLGTNTNSGVTFGGSGTLTCGGVSFGSGRTFTLNNGALATLSGGTADITIPGLITGTGGFVKPNTGFGFILSNSSNDFSGPLYVLNSNNNSNQAVKVAGIGDTPGAGVITIGDPGNSGAISWFSWTGGAKTFNNRQFGFSSGNARLYNDGTGALTINTDLFSIWPTVNGTLNLGGSYSGGGNTIAGRIGDPGPGKTNSLTKAADSSIWVLSGSNTYSGVTTISGGILCFANKAAQATNTITVANTAGTYGGLGVGGAGYYSATDVSNLFVNALIGFSMAGVNAGVAIDTTAGDFSYSVNITNRNLCKLGANTLTLSGVNSNGLTAVKAGTLSFANRNALYRNTPGAWTKAKITVESNATFAAAVGANASGYFDTTDLDTLLDGTHLGASDASSGLMSGAKLGLDTANASGGNLSYNSAIANPNSGANVLGLAKLGANTLTLGGTNTYTGPTAVRAGMLQLAKTNALYNGDTTKWTAANITVTNGATLALNVGGTGEFTASDVDTVKAIGTATGGFQSGSTLALDTANASGGNFTYNSAIANPNGGANVLGFTKLGANTNTLGGNNTYGGPTTINAGVLRVTGQSSPNSGTGTNSVTVNAGGTLSGNGRVGGPVTVANSASAVLHPNSGATLTLGGNLTLNANSTVKFSLSATAGGANDKVVIENKTVSCGGATVTIDSAGTLDTSTDYVLIDAGSGSVSGSFVATPAWSGTQPGNYSSYTIITNAAGTQLRLHYNATGTPPTATNDVAATEINTPVTIAVTTNDAGIIVPPITVLTALTWPGSTVLVTNNTSVYYVPASGSNGVDTFQYVISNSYGSATGTVSVTVADTTPPAAPTLASPTNNAATMNTTPAFTWNAVTDVSGIARYDLVIDTTTNNVGNVTSYVSGVLGDGMHAWKVRAVDQAANTGAFSTVWNLVVDTTPPSAPVLVSPTNTATVTDPTPTFTWNAATEAGSGIARYDILIDSVTNNAGTSTNYTPGVNLSLASHTWQVRAVDAVANTGSWSAPWSFTVVLGRPHWQDQSAGWTNASNWDTALQPQTDEIATFTNDTAYVYAPTSVATAYGALDFKGAASFSFAGTATQTLSAPVGYGIWLESGAGAVSNGDVRFALGAAQSYKNDSANPLVIGGTVTNAGYLLTLDGTGAGETRLTNVVSGAGGLTVNRTGSGVVTLAGPNTFSGQMTIQQGTVSIPSMNNISANGPLGNNALPVILGGNGTTGTVSYTGGTASSTKKFTMAASGAGVFDVGSGVILTNSAVLDGSGMLIKTGSGTLTLGGTNTFGGGLTIKAGTVTAATSTNALGGSGIGAVYLGDTSGSASATLNGYGATLANPITVQAGSSGNTLTIGNSGAVNAIFSGALTLGKDVTVTANGGSVKLSGQITGSGAINATGTGMVTLEPASDNNTFSGGVTLSSGTTLNINTNTSLGSAAGVFTINGGTISAATAITVANNNTNVWNGDFTFTGTAALNLGSGPVTLGSNRQVTVSASTLTVGGAIDDGVNTYSLTKAGVGTLVLGGNNTFGGGLVINGGTVTISTTNNLGIGGITFTGNGTLDPTNLITYDGAITITNGALAVIKGVAGGTNVFNGAITGTGGMQVGYSAGNKYWEFRSLGNTFEGPVLIGNNNSAVVTFNSLADSATATGVVRFVGLNTSAAQGGFVWGTGATNPLVLNNRQIEIANTVNGIQAVPYGIVNNNANPANTIMINRDLLVTATATSLQYLGLRGTNTGNNVFAGRIADGTGAVVIAVSKLDSGTWILTGANTFSGGTTINGGTLQIGVDSVGTVGAITSSALGTGGLTLTSGTLSSGDTTARSILNAVTFGGNMTLGDASNSGALTFSNTVALGAATRTLTINSPVAFAGVISSSGAFGITKTGSGTLTLSGANTYTGATTIANGTLSISANSDLGDPATGAQLSLGGGTLQLNGTFALDNAGANSRPVALTASSTIDVTGGHAATISGVISGTGFGYTKIGTGTLILSATNTYSGVTTISNGSLRVVNQTGTASGTGTNAVQVIVGSLGGNGRIAGPVTIADDLNAMLYPNNGVSGGTLTISNNVTFLGSNAVAKFDLSSTYNGANDGVVLVNKTLTCSNATVVINSAGVLDTADYVLFSVGSGTIAGTFAATPVWTGVTPANVNDYSVMTIGNQVVLHYATAALPVAGNDGATTFLNTRVTVAVTTNDSNFDIPIAGVITGAVGSVVTVTNSTSIAYTPALNSTNTDSFQYVLTNAYGSATGTVTVTILVPPLTANNDSATTLVNSAVSIRVTTNDAYFAAPIASVLSNALWAGSTLVITNGTNVLYSPAVNTAGTDQFQYVITNLFGQSATGTVNVAVAIPAITARVDNAATFVNTPVTIRVTTNDANFAAPIASVLSNTLWAGSTLVISSGTNVLYTPAANSNGTDQFRYVITNVFGHSATGTVNVTVGIPPLLASNDTALTYLDTPVTIPVTLNDSNFVAPIGSVLTGLLWPGSSVTVTNGTNVLYSPAAGSNGLDQFQYVLTNAFGQSATGRVDVTVALPALTAGNDAATTYMNRSLTIHVTTNDQFFVAPIASVTHVTWPDSVLTIAGTNILYTPPVDSNGVDSFQYVITNAVGDSATGTVTVTVSNLTAYTWDGGGADDDWQTGANWNNDAFPRFPAPLTFAGTTRLTPTNTFTGKTVGTNGGYAITFAAGAGSFVIGGNPITLAGNITNASSSAQTINLGMDLGSAVRTLSAGTGQVLTLAGALSGDAASGLTAVNGTVALTGTNTYGGTTTLSGGTLVGATTNAFGTGALVLSGAGSTLRLVNDDGGTFGNNTTNTASMTIQLDRASPGAGVTSTLGALRAATASMLTVTNGGNVTSGTAGLVFGTAALGSGANTPTFDVAGGVNLTLGALTPTPNAGAFIKQGAGTLTLNTASALGNNSDRRTINAGTVVLGAGSAMGAVNGDTYLNGGTLQLNQTVDTAYVFGTMFVTNGTFTVVNNVNDGGVGKTATLGSGNAKLKIGTYALTVTNGNGVTSGTAGVAFAGQNSPSSYKIELFGSPTFNIGSSAGVTTLLTLGGLTNSTASSQTIHLQGNGNFAQSTAWLAADPAYGLTLDPVFSGTATLGQANTFSGNTLVNGGTLVLTNNLALQNSTFDTSGAGTLNLAAVNTPTFGGLIGSGNLVLPANVTELKLNPAVGRTNTYAGAISGGTNAKLTLIGAGTTLLDGTNAYAGLTTVSAGALGGGGAVAGGLTFSNNTTFVAQPGKTLAVAGNLTINGSCTVTVIGTPVVGTIYNLMTFASRGSSTFAVTNAPAGWKVQHDTQRIILYDATGSVFTFR